MLYTTYWKRQYNGNKLKAWLFQGLHSFIATHLTLTDALKETRQLQTTKATATFFGTNMKLEVRASSHRLLCGMKPQSTTWNLNPSSNQWNDQKHS